MRVQDVVVWHDALGLSPEEIVSHHPGLGLADVYAALAYYHDHADQIRRHMAEDDVIAEAAHGRMESKLVAKLGGRHGGSNPLPLDEHVAIAERPGRA